MKYCNKCGARLLENAQICRKCGKKVEHMPILDILLYIFGILFCVIGFVDILTGQAGGMADLWMSLAGLTMLPLPYKLIEQLIRKSNPDYKSNGALIVTIRVILPLVFLVLMFLFYKSYVQIVESKGEPQYTEAFVMENGKVYYYGLSEFNVLVDDSYMSLGKAYKQDSGVISEVLELLMLNTEYEDGAKLYNNKTYSVLKCSNGDLVIGNSKLKFEKGFCGKDEVPSEVSNKEVVDDEDSTDKDKNDEDKEENNLNNNQTEIDKDPIGVGRDDEMHSDEETNTNNGTSNNENESSGGDKESVSVDSKGTINHQRLYDVYHNNMLDGRNKYFNRRIKVNTVFTYISKSDNGSYILNMEHVHCTSFINDSVVGSLADLNRGQSLTISGVVNEWDESKGTLELRTCEIVR